MLVCIHGRHGSNSFVKFAKSVGNYEILLANQLKHYHLERKFVCITRDPMEKFMSGLDHYIKDLSGTMEPNAKHLLKLAFFASTMSLRFEKVRKLNVKRPSSSNSTQPEFDTLSWLCTDIPRSCFRYHMGDPHMAFTNLSIVSLIALGCNVEVLNVKDLNGFYKEYGYIDESKSHTGRYSENTLKKAVYNKNLETYFESFQHCVNDDMFHPDKDEFHNLMDIEYKAYNAISSENKLMETRKFCKDLAWGLISLRPRDYRPHKEVSYLTMCADAQDVPSRLMQYMSGGVDMKERGFIPVISLFNQIMGVDLYNQDVIEGCYRTFDKVAPCIDPNQ